MPPLSSFVGGEGWLVVVGGRDPGSSHRQQQNTVPVDLPR
jgi:hypothetical protein